MTQGSDVCWDDRQTPSDLPSPNASQHRTHSSRDSASSSGSRASRHAKNPLPGVSHTPQEANDAPRALAYQTSNRMRSREAGFLTSWQDLCFFYTAFLGNVQQLPSLAVVTVRHWASAHRNLWEAFLHFRFHNRTFSFTQRLTSSRQRIPGVT